MAIVIDSSAKRFTLHTANTSYQMMVGEYGYLFHLYYGDSIGDGDCSYLLYKQERSLCSSPFCAGEDRAFTLDTAPQEYSAGGAGDTRLPCIIAEFPNGGRALDLHYFSHELLAEKPALKGLPSLQQGEKTCQTLEITLKDSDSEVYVILQYTVFEEDDCIARSCRVENRTGAPLRLEAALSACLEREAEEDLDLISFWGRHTMERNVERRRVSHGKIVVDSARGTSSAQQSPFVILCDHHATEDAGRCWGLNFVYSGNFAASAERSQLGSVRVTMGINPETFSWKLEDGESFQAPEVILSYSGCGLSRLSSNYHRILRENMCRGAFKDCRRPVLINNWEATYFDFNTDKLVRIAETASKLGVELLVMDDGWFGKRDSDWSGLGDWTVNEKKLPGGMQALCSKINALGMKLGVWFEPEMVSEDSDLFRQHPEWVLRIEGRGYSRNRYQLVLDMSRQDVREHLYQQISKVLSSANIEYVKWDMNRPLSEVWSQLLPADRQGEVSHRYTLGVYELMDRLTTDFPHILFEGCSSGGNRYDAGLLYYMPQIWCSDNTDAIERLEIQYGTSFGFPMSALGAHVSACPNHQTGRTTPLFTRGVVAMAGTFGYELDLNTLTEEEKEQVKEQIAAYKKHYDTINKGEYYRLTDPTRNRELCAWEFVSRDKKKALLFAVGTHVRANVAMPVIRMKGLDAGKQYRLTCQADHPLTEKDVGAKDGVYSGAVLMNAGIRTPMLKGDWPAFCVELEEVENT